MTDARACQTVWLATLIATISLSVPTLAQPAPAPLAPAGSPAAKDTAAPGGADAKEKAPTLGLQVPAMSGWALPGIEEKSLPITWAAVLELSQASATEVDLAVERVHQAHLQLAFARSSWIPKLYLGGTWYHHDGRDQLIPGEIIDTSKSFLAMGPSLEMKFDPSKTLIETLKAKQQIHQRSGELDRAKRDTLQKASQAYVDLVAAQGGAVIALEVNDRITDLVDRADKALQQGVGTKVDVIRVRAQYQSQVQIVRTALQKHRAAAAQLGQMLSMSPDTYLFAADRMVLPVRLVDEHYTQDELIRLALDQGPGIAEAVSILALLDEQEAQAKRYHLIPVVEGFAGGGSFAGGTGGTIDNWGDRSDFALNLKWDVTRALGSNRLREMNDSRRREAGLELSKVKEKLTTGVIVSYQTAKVAEIRIRESEKELALATEALDLSDARLKGAVGQAIEVSQAILQLSQAKRHYLEAVTDYNRAQITLSYLIGLHGPTTLTPLQPQEVKIDEAGKAVVPPPAPVNIANEPRPTAQSTKPRGLWRHLHRSEVVDDNMPMETLPAVPDLPPAAEELPPAAVAEAMPFPAAPDNVQPVVAIEPLALDESIRVERQPTPAATAKPTARTPASSPRRTAGTFLKGLFNR